MYSFFPLLVVLFVGLWANAFGTPIYVTIEGEQHAFNELYENYPNEIEMVLMIESSLQGTYTTPDGIVHEYGDYWVNGEAGPEYVDYLFADLVSLKTTLDVSQWQDYRVVDQIDLNYINYALVNNWGSFFCNSNLCINVPHETRIDMHNDNYGHLWTNLVPGYWVGYTGLTQYDPTENIFKSIPAYDLHITSISDINPIATIPEPQIAFLLGTGLASLFVIRRKNQKK